MGKIFAGDLLEFLCAITKHLLQSPIGFNNFTLKIFDYDAGAGTLKNRAKARLAITQQAFRFLSLRTFGYFLQGALDRGREVGKMLFRYKISRSMLKQVRHILLTD